jgi:sugar-specific transcriptional regulator TrmB
VVRASFDSRTVYAAIDLDTALDSTVKKHEHELREMEAQKRELQELPKQQQFRPSEEVSTFTIIKSIRDGRVMLVSLLTKSDSNGVKDL